MEMVIHLSKYFANCFCVFDDGLFDSWHLQSLLCVQWHICGPLLSRSVSWCSGGLQSNICKWDAFWKYIYILLFPLNGLGLIQLKFFWRLPASPKRGHSLSCVQPDKHVSIVIWLFPGCGQEAHTSSFPVTCFEILVKGVQHSGGGWEGGRAGCRVFLVKGNESKVQTVFPQLRYE